MWEIMCHYYIDDCVLSMHLYNLDETHFIILFSYKDTPIMKTTCLALLLCVSY